MFSLSSEACRIKTYCNDMHVKSLSQGHCSGFYSPFWVSSIAVRVFRPITDWSPVPILRLVNMRVLPMLAAHCFFTDGLHAQVTFLYLPCPSHFLPCPVLWCVQNDKQSITLISRIVLIYYNENMPQKVINEDTNMINVVLLVYKHSLEIVQSNILPAALKPLFLLMSAP